MHGGHVAIHADTSHETDAQVHVGEEQDPGDAADHVAKDPVVAVEVVVDLKRQSAEDDDVRQSQITDVDAEGRARSRLEGEDE